MLTVVTPDHLEHVMSAMKCRGGPRIRAFLDVATGAWFASEGIHRLRAAICRELAPVLVPIRWWRSAAALERARFAALLRGHWFPRIEVAAC